MNTEHNHPIQNEALNFLPKERKLALEELAGVSGMLSKRLNKKEYQGQKSTDKMVTLKDITNHSKKLKPEPANPEEKLDKLQNSGVVNLDQTNTSQNHTLSEQEKYRLSYQIGQDVAEHLLRFDGEEFYLKLECLKSICQLWKEECRVKVTEEDNVSESGSNSMERPLKKRRKIKRVKKVPKVKFSHSDHSHHKCDQEVESSELDLGSFMAL